MVRWWKDAHLWVKGLLVLALPVAALLAMGIANLVVANQLDGLSQTTSRTTASIGALNGALERTLDAETGVRGYAATGDPAFLQPYNEAVKELTPLQHGYTVDGLSRAQTVQLRALGTQLFTRLANVKTQLAAGTLHGAALDRQLVAAKGVEDRIRVVVGAGIDAQQDALADQQAQVVSAEDTARIISIAGMVVGVVVGLLAMLILLRGVLWRVARLGRNVDNFLTGKPMEMDSPSTEDEIGHLEQVLLGAAGLLGERERELQNARDQALAATQAKDAFLGRMSHELRTPLTAILGFGQLLQLEDLSQDDTDSVNHIVSAGEHLLALIEDLLDISSIETDHLSLSLEPILLEDLVVETVGLMGPLATAGQVTVDVHGLGAGVVQADRQRLKQVLLNLLSNAIKYNRIGGTVSVTWEPGPGMTTVDLTVKDSGIGILAEHVGRLFQPFERLGAEGTGVQGTGVGLSLSKSLTEAMHGTIEAESEQGVGSAFTVTLPAVDLHRLIDADADADADAVVAGGQAAGSLVPVGRGGTVLYAEDNLASLAVVERLLSRRGETLQVAIQGNLVLELAKCTRPTLILLDLHLPDMSGEDVLRALKADPATADIPVAILSANAGDRRQQRLLKQGAVAYLTKPLDVMAFLAVLDQNTVGPPPATPAAAPATATREPPGAPAG